MRDTWWCLSCMCVCSQFSLANADLPVQVVVARGVNTFQRQPLCPARSNESISQTLLLKRSFSLYFQHMSSFIFSPILPCMAQREWDMFDSILFFFLLFFKSQMLRQFTLIKLQLALKLSCINFSSIYREQDRWFKLHAIWGNARDICYRVNCLKLRLLSPFGERKTFALMLTELGKRISCSNGVCADFHPLLLAFALLQGLASQGCSAAPVTSVPAALCKMQRQSVRGIPGQGSPQILWRTEPGGSRVWFCANKHPSSSPR